MPEDREQKLAEIADNGAFDVIVVGGGINGIGAFRELSFQGLRILLVERSDYCSGCSAAPSRMIHGGLRYLESGEFGLVRESLCERDALLRNAPHMVRPLPTTVPIRSTFSGVFNGAANFLRLRSRPAERGALSIKMGLVLYDWVTRHRRVLPRHKFHGRAKAHRLWPMLRPDIRFTATYFDAWISHPERLGLELLDDTESGSNGSIALNYCALETLDDGSLHLRDGGSKRSWPVTARTIVNATGAWVDQTADELPGNHEAENPMVEGTKGSHLVISNPKLKSALSGHMIYYENSDGRVCILFPYLSNVLVGATDIRVKTPGRTRCEEEEKSYILQSLAGVFPDVEIEPEEIVFSYSGIRPLPKSDQEFTGRISRGHFVKRLDGPIPQYCMVGGKWTTFRAFAEQTADLVLSELDEPRCNSTLHTPIGGGRDFPKNIEQWIHDVVSRYEICRERAEHVLDAYGSNALAVLEACRATDADGPVVPGCPYSQAEIEYLIDNERVVHLSDIILRRTSLAITGQISDTSLRAIAGIAAQRLGWDDARKEMEISSLLQELDFYHGVSAQTLEKRSC